MSRALADHGLPVNIARDAERYVFVLHTLQDTDDKKDMILEAYTQGFHAVFAAITAMAATALALSFLIRRFNMDTGP